MSKIRNPKDYFPKRFGLQYDPPAIILEYLLQPSGKLYHHKMKINNLQPDSQPIQVLSQLKNRHYMYFLENKLKDHQITILVEKIKQRLFKNQNSKKQASSNQIKNNQQRNNFFDENYYEKEEKSYQNNKISDKNDFLNQNNNNKQNNESDEYNSPNKKQQDIEPNNKQDLYNLTDNISPLSSRNQVKQSNNYSEQHQNDFYYNDKKDSDYLQQEKQNTQSQEKQNNNMWDEIDVGDDDDFQQEQKLDVQRKKSSDDDYDEYDDDFEASPRSNEEDQFDYNNTNLNTLTTEELQKHKDKMEEKFRQNSKKPGDEGYEYDKRQDFEVNEDIDNDWDD